MLWGEWEMLPGRAARAGSGTHARRPTDTVTIAERTRPGDITIWLAEAALSRDDTGNALSALKFVGLQDDRLVPILQKVLAC